MVSTNGRAPSLNLALVEAILAAVLGAIVCRTFTGVMFAAFGSQANAVTWLGFLFHGWPGFLDLACLLSIGEGAFSANGLLVYATAVGAVVGFWDGWHQIHDWRRWKGLTFLADLTWGGAAVGIGSLIHFLNMGWGRFIDSRRIGAHRYDSGIAAKRQFAITVGNVCSNLNGQSDGGLFRHEAIHVLQNRIFGPIYLYSYVGWTAALFPPALIWGFLVRRPFALLFSWCYLNNPWEEWAYRYGGSRNPSLVWPTRRIVAVSAAYAVAFVATAWLVVVRNSNG